MIPVPRLWPGATVALIGAGPSLTPADVDACRGLRVIAINRAVEWAPWADVLYACDAKLWNWIGGAPTFAGLKYGLDPDTPAAWGVSLLRNTGPLGLERDPSGVRTGKNSGYQAINLAVHLGATRILPARLRHGAGRRWADAFPRAAPGRASDAVPVRPDARGVRDLVEPLAAIGVTVINCSRQTTLDVFPRQALPEDARRGRGMSARVFGVDYQFLSCGDVFTRGLVHAAAALGVDVRARRLERDRPAGADRAGAAGLVFVVHGRRFVERWRHHAAFASWPTAVWLVDEPYEVDDTVTTGRAVPARVSQRRRHAGAASRRHRAAGLLRPGRALSGSKARGDQALCGRVHRRQQPDARGGARRARRGRPADVSGRRRLRAPRAHRPRPRRQHSAARDRRLVSANPDRREHLPRPASLQHGRPRRDGAQSARLRGDRVRRARRERMAAGARHARARDADVSHAGRGRRPSSRDLLAHPMHAAAAARALRRAPLRRTPTPPGCRPCSPRAGSRRPHDAPRSAS